jgi:hypothetical protein
MSTMATTTTTTTQSAVNQAAPPGPSAPSQGEQLDEAVLADDVLEKVKTLALDELPGGTVIGIEADADGAAYVAHMLNADGTPMTVYVDESFEFLDIS